MDNTSYYREPQDENEEENIQIEYSPKFYETAKKLSDHINSLPIGQPENDRLIELILNHVKTAAQETFDQARKHSTKLSEWALSFRST